VFAASLDGPLLVLARGAVSLVDPVALRGVRASTLVSAGPMRSRRGEWWVPTAQGLFRFAAMPAASLASARPVAVYGERHGIRAAGVVFEDRSGDIWVGTLGPAGETLVRLEPATERVQRYGPGQGLPASSVPGVIVETADGDLWIAFREGGLGRIRDGRFEIMRIPGLTPQLLYGLVAGLLGDRRGRLWVGTRTHGAALVDVRGPPTVVKRFDVTSGLSSDFVRPLVEDRNGRVYLGGYHGIDRVDPETGAVRRYSTADGLASPIVSAAYVDRKGDVWFATSGGVSQLRAGAEEANEEPPRARVASLRVAGAPWHIAPLGSTDVTAPNVTGTKNRFEIGLIGLGPALDDSLRFQTRLVGGDEQWSVPTRQRVVTLASLAAGRYTFEARAVDGRGHTSPPARVGITVLPPVWHRWWFLLAAAGALAGLAYAAHRYRVARLLAVERIRARIATDLHDDIGSGLSQIAIHSEVVRRRLDRDQSAVTGSLAVISETSTALVDAMSDIVWAINPERDSLADLAHRMRRFVSDTLTPREIDFTFEAPDDDALSLSADVRREVFLVLKESVNNVVRHSGCRSAMIRLERDRRRLALTVQDDGRGFDPAQRVDGNGLASMRRRVVALGGRLAIDSTPGAGTTVRLEVEPRST
jgi:signal transduction histidine kinase/streptogramin lyase